MWNYLIHTFYYWILSASNFLIHRRNLERKDMSLPTAKSILGEDRQKYRSMFPEVAHDLSQLVQNGSFNEESAWLQKMLEYNLLGVKMTGGMILLTAYRILVDSSKRDMKLAHVMGWCADLGSIMLVDDMMDGTETRGGQPCWYKLGQVGQMAANDAIFLNTAIYAMMKKHHKGHPYYLDCLEVFHWASFRSSVGQALDMLTIGPDSRPRLELFTEDNYSVLVKNNTGCALFVAPVALAMYMAGIRDKQVHMQVEKVLLDISRRFKAQNDFMDCFGDVEVTGKNASDIQGGKCSWLVVNALKIADEEQRKVLQECYGSDDPVKVAKVVDLYAKLELPRLHAEFQDKSRLSILEDIEHLPSWELQALCKTVMDIIYNGKCSGIY